MTMRKHSGVLIWLAVAFLVDSANAETAIYNVRGYTSSDAGMRQFSTLIFADDGKVIATGNAELLEKHENARRINGAGRTLLPGLIDAHAHVSSLGLLKSNLNLAGIPSVAAAVAEISRYAKVKPHARWILG